MSRDYRKHFHERGEFVLEILRAPANVGRRSLVGTYVSVEDGDIFKVTAWDNSRLTDPHYLIEFADGSASRLDDDYVTDVLKAGRLRNVRFRTMSFDKYIELLTNGCDHALSYLVDRIEGSRSKRSRKPDIEVEAGFIRDLLVASEPTVDDPLVQIEALRCALKNYLLHEATVPGIAFGSAKRLVDEEARRRARGNWLASVIEANASAPPSPEGRSRAFAFREAERAADVAPRA